MKKSKPYEIPKIKVLEAYKLVKRNKGSAGRDEISFEDFEEDLKENLYKIWNRKNIENTTGRSHKYSTCKFIYALCL